MIENNHLFLFKTAVGLLSLAAFILSYRYLVLRNVSERTFKWWATSIWMMSRVGLFLAIFVVAGYAAHSDVLAYYYPQAKAAIRGELVYRDFSSSYGPGFPYLASLSVIIWDSPKSIIMMSILIDGLAAFCWRRLSTSLLDKEGSRIVLLLYLCNPVVILTVAVSGQNQVWVAALWALAGLCAIRGRDFTCGFLLVASAGLVKILGLLVVPSFLLTAENKLRSTAGLIAGCTVFFLPFLMSGTDVLRSLRAEALDISSGNLPFLATLLGINVREPGLAGFFNAFLIVSLMAAVFAGWWLHRHCDAQSLRFSSICLVLLTLMLISKKSYTNYLVLFAFPLGGCVVIAGADLKRSLTFLIFSALAALEPSLWFRWLGTSTFGEVLAKFPHANQLPISFWLFLLVEVLLIGGYCWLLTSCLLAAASCEMKSETRMRPAHALGTQDL